MSCNNLNGSYAITNAGLLFSGVASLLAPVCLVYNHYNYMMICVIICGLAIGPLTSLTPITLVEEFGIKRLSISYGMVQLFTGLANILALFLPKILFGSVNNFYSMEFIFPCILFIISLLIGLFAQVKPFYKFKEGSEAVDNAPILV